MKRFASSRILLILLGFSSWATASELAVLRNGYSIPHEQRKVLGAITRLYVGNVAGDYIDIPTDQIDHFDVDPVVKQTSFSALKGNRIAVSMPALSSTSSSAAASRPILDEPSMKELIDSASSRNHLDPALVNSVIRAESGFNYRARSPKGARGLMQLMPQTASQLGVGDAYDPKENVQGGARYLRELLEQYNFDLVKALAAYNAGPMRVQQYRGVPPFRETRAYVARIVKDYNRRKLAELKSASSKPGAKHAKSARASSTHRSTLASITVPTN